MWAQKPPPCAFQAVTALQVPQLWPGVAEMAERVTMWWFCPLMLHFILIFKLDLFVCDRIWLHASETTSDCLFSHGSWESDLGCLAWQPKSSGLFPDEPSCQPKARVSLCWEPAIASGNFSAAWLWLCSHLKHCVYLLLYFSAKNSHFVWTLNQTLCLPVLFVLLETGLQSPGCPRFIL